MASVCVGIDLAKNVFALLRKKSAPKGAISVSRASAAESLRGLVDTLPTKEAQLRQARFQHQIFRPHPTVKPA